MRLRDRFTQAEREAVEAALGRAEALTSGEIVPVVVSCSGRYDRAEDLFGLLLGAAAVLGAWGSLPAALHPGDWGGGLPAWGRLLLALGLGFLVGVGLSSRFWALRLPFIPPSEMEQEVDRRAAECFFRFGVGRTRGGTGVLILLSVYEQRAVVLGDAPVAEVLGPEAWQEVCDRLLRGLREGRLAAGLEEAILRCGELMAPHFPRAAEDVDELPNRLHLVEEVVLPRF